jgi:2-polyprenyl-3-methyl-5-hydroxy-6-metoxy-1,4-benzoquinol methylase
LQTFETRQRIRKSIDLCPTELLMAQPADTFYEDMATAYHLIFDDWNAAIERQQAVLSRLLPPPAAAGAVLDCACGIGTQALGLARAGYAVEGTDLSNAEIERAKAEAAARHLDIAFRVDDMRQLRTSSLGAFGVVLAFDNALPHLDSDEDVQTALSAMRDRLCPGGRLFLSLRDYGPLMEQRPGMRPPAMFSDEGRRRIVHQVWDWQDERRYTVHIFITRQLLNDRWATSHFVGHLRAIAPWEVAAHAEQVGFRQVQVLSPEETGYYQPIVAAIRP